MNNNRNPFVVGVAGAIRTRGRGLTECLAKADGRSGQAKV